MADISLADAKARLSELVGRAAAGEAIQITRRGRPIARLTSVATPRAPIDVAALRALTAKAAPAPDAGDETVQRMRADARY